MAGTEGARKSVILSTSTVRGDDGFWLMQLNLHLKGNLGSLQFFDYNVSK